MIGERGVRGYFLKKHYRRVYIAVFFFVIIPVADILYYAHLMTQGKGILSSDYSTFEHFIIFFNTAILLIIFAFLFGTVKDDKQKNTPSIEIKSKLKREKDLALYSELADQTIKLFYNIFYSFSFYCFKCKKIITSHYNTKVYCGQCNDYGLMSRKIKKCKCKSILRYVECPHCNTEIDLLNKEYDHNKIKQSLYE